MGMGNGKVYGKDGIGYAGAVDAPFEDFILVFSLLGVFFGLFLRLQAC